MENHLGQMGQINEKYGHFQVRKLVFCCGSGAVVPQPIAAPPSPPTSSAGFHRKVRWLPMFCAVKPAVLAFLLVFGQPSSDRAGWCQIQRSTDFFSFFSDNFSWKATYISGENTDGFPVRFSHQSVENSVRLAARLGIDPTHLNVA